MHEPGDGRVHPRPASPVQWQTLREFGGGYWWVVVAGGVFTLARFSEAFLILRAQQLGLADTFAPLVLVIMNVVYAVSAYPSGRLADRMSHKKLLAAGLAVLILSDLVLAQAQGLAAVVAGVVLWGLHMGLTQGLLATMVAGAAPDHLRGTAFGFFSLVSGIAMLIASVLAGLLWDEIGAATTFHAGAAFSVLALVILFLRRSS